MLVAGIETSGRVGSVCLSQGGGLLHEDVFAEGLVHGREVAPALGRCLERTGRRLSDVGLLAVAEGPGSYTGIRIGLVFGRVLGCVASIPVRGVGSLEGLAHAAGAPPGAVVAATVDARWGRLYHALFRAGPDGVERLTDDALLTPAEARARTPAGAVAAGGGAPRRGPRLPAAVVAELGLRAFLRHGAADPSPRYLKPWGPPRPGAAPGRGGGCSA